MHHRWRTLAGTTKHTPSAFWVAMTSYSDSSLFGVGTLKEGAPQRVLVAALASISLPSLACALGNG